MVERASASAGEELERLPSLEQGLRDESLCQMGEVRKEHKRRGSSISDKVGSLGMCPVGCVCVCLRKGEGKFLS